MDANQLGRNSSKFNDRNNLQISNADLFISNNNNPFLISPYAPPANVAKETTVVDINETISTLIGNLSSIINLSTFTLSISTIQPIPSDPNQEITIIASTLRLDVVDTVIYGTLEVDGNSKFNNISTGYLFASVADISTLNVSTFNANTLNINNFQASTITVSSLYGNNAFINSLSTGQLFASVADISSLNVSTISASGTISFSTLIGSTITANTMTIHSTLNVSSIDATGHISFVTMSGSTITANTVTIHSTLNASTISTSNINFLTLDGGKGTISEFTFSSINMVPGVISTAATTFHSSFIINIGANKYKIPLEKI
jgi:hypothetical protein